MGELIRKEEISEFKNLEVTIFEKCFIPKNDPKLLEQGIEICAKTIYNKPKNKIENRVVFLKDHKEVSEIGCIHTQACVIKKVPLSDRQKEELELEKTGESYEIVSTEKFPEIKEEIEPDQHYIALKSFVGHLVEEGIENSIIDSMKFKLGVNDGTIAYGYDLLDNTTSTQLIRALNEIDPKYSSELALFALDYMTGDVSERLRLFAEDFKPVLCELSPEGVKRLDTINGGIAEITMDIQACLADRSDLPISVMEKLSNASGVIKLKLAINKGLPPHLIRKLALDKSSSIRQQISERTDLPPDVVSLLASPRESRNVIVSILRSQPEGSIPSDRFPEFASSLHPEIRRALAKREDLPESIFGILMNDDDDEVLNTLAKNENLPRPYILRLAKSSDDEVRTSIAGRPNLSPALMQLLSKDPNENVRIALIDMNGKNLPTFVLEELSKDDNDRVRISLTYLDEDLPKEISHILMRDQETDIRKSIAMHSDIDQKELVEWISREKNPFVQKKLSLRKDLNNQQIDHFIETGDYETKFTMGFERLNLTEDQLLSLARDPYFYVRIGVARRLQKLPNSVLETLSNDSNSSVLRDLQRRNDLPLNLRKKVLDSILMREVEEYHKSSRRLYEI